MHWAWFRICSFHISFITSVAGSMAGWEEGKSLCNIWRWWWAIHIAISSNLRIKDLKKWQHRDSGVGVMKGKKKKKKKEQWDLCKPPGSALEISVMKNWDCSEWDFIEEKSQCCVKGERLAGSLTSLSWFSLLFPESVCIAIPVSRSCSQVKYHMDGKTFWNLINLCCC